MLAKILGVVGVGALVIIGGVLIFKNNVADPATSVAAVAKAVNKRSPTPAPCPDCAGARAALEKANKEAKAAWDEYHKSIPSFSDVGGVSFSPGKSREIQEESGRRAREADEKQRLAKQALVDCLRQSKDPKCKEEGREVFNKPEDPYTTRADGKWMNPDGKIVNKKGLK